MSEKKSKTWKLTTKQKSDLEKDGWELISTANNYETVWFGDDYENLSPSLLEMIPLPIEERSWGANFLVVAFMPDYYEEEDVEDE